MVVHLGMGRLPQSTECWNEVVPATGESPKAKHQLLALAAKDGVEVVNRPFGCPPIPSRASFGKKCGARPSEHELQRFRSLLTAERVALSRASSA